MYKSAISMVLIVTLSGLLQGCLGPAVVSAGIGAAMMAEDPRTAGVIVDDRIIVSKLSSRIRDKYPDKAKIHVTSYNNVVLLTGQVSEESIKDDLQLMVLETQSVRDFKDETIVREFSTFREFHQRRRHKDSSSESVDPKQRCKNSQSQYDCRSWDRLFNGFGNSRRG